MGGGGKNGKGGYFRRKKAAAGKILPAMRAARENTFPAIITINRAAVFSRVRPRMPKNS